MKAHLSRGVWKTLFRRICRFSQLLKSGHLLPPIQLWLYPNQRGSERGRALTSYHPPQNAIKWEETASPSPLAPAFSLPAGGGRRIGQGDRGWHSFFWVLSFHPHDAVSHTFCFVDSYGASAPGGGLQRRLQQLLGCESTIVFSCSLLPRGPAFPDDVEISQYAQLV